MSEPKVIRLAIDGNEANVLNRVGSNVYAFEILKELEVLTRPATEKSVFHKVTVLLSAPPVKDLPPAREGWQYQILKPQKFWTQWALPIHLFLHQSRYDVLFTPGHYAPRLSSIPYVSSVMDLAFLEFGHQFQKNDLLQLRHWTEYSVKHARKVIAISEATKQDVIKKYHRQPADVIIAYPSVSMPDKEPTSLKKASTLKKLSLKKPFLVYVGTLQPRKNIIRLVEAFESVKLGLASEKVRSKIKTKRQNPAEKLQLVIAGKIGWLADDTVQRIKESPFFADIILTGYVSDEVKTILLREAEASLSVGLSEGFGIPALESIQLGTIPIVSNTTSLPEVVGKAGILVTPTNHLSIAEGIRKVLRLTAKDKASGRGLIAE